MDLCIDTSTKKISITIGDEEFYKTFSSEKAKKQNLYLIKIFTKILNEINIKLEDIKNYYFTIGPGSFTGTRSGISFLLGLTAGREVKYFPVSTLEAISLSNEGISTPILPQSSENFYAGIYRVGNSIKEILKPNFFHKEELMKIKKGSLLTIEGLKISIEGLIQIKTPLSEAIFLKRKLIKEKKLPIKPIYIQKPYDI